jgi:hypothetical protein
MRKLFYVDLEMCGGDNLPEDFDLEEFCEVLQGKVPEIEIVPVTGLAERIPNASPGLVSQRAFDEALGEYCHR